MMTTLSDKGHVALPLTLREKYKLKPGDDFEIVVETADGGTPEITLRKRSAQTDWLEVLRGCPVKGFTIPARAKDLPRKVVL